MSSHPTRTSAPLGVKLLAAAVAVDGGIALLHGLGALAAGDLPVAVLVGGFSMMQLLVAVGLWALEPYAWGVAAFATGSVLVVEVATGQLPGAALSGGVLLYLLSTKRLFET